MDIWSKEKRSEVMRKITSKNTKPEITLRKRLYERGYRYRLHVKALPGKPDIVFHKYRLAIFVHGCFWHFHEHCREGRIPSTNTKFWNDKLLKNIDRDKKHNQDLLDMGWSVITIWECEIDKSLGDVLNKLELIFSASGAKKAT